MKDLYIALAVLVIIGGGAWLLLQNQNSVPGSTTTDASSATTTAPTKAAGTARKAAAPKVAWAVQGVNSLDFLLTQKLVAKCSVTANGRMGTLYLDGARARLDLATASMIDDGAYIYVWSGASGVRLLAPLSASGSVAASRGGVDPAATLSYGCNPAAVEASRFAAPSTVRFVDGAGNPI